jgi:hypothetical protein
MRGMWKVSVRNNLRQASAVHTAGGHGVLRACVQTTRLQDVRAEIRPQGLRLLRESASHDGLRDRDLLRWGRAKIRLCTRLRRWDRSGSLAPGFCAEVIQPSSMFSHS